MNVVEAAKQCFYAIEVIPERDSKGQSIEHAAWVLSGIMCGYIQEV